MFTIMTTQAVRKTAKMWKQVEWTNDEEAERDILLMAEYGMPTSDGLDSNLNKVPDTVKNYKKKIASNQGKALNSDLDDSASYVVSGRGRGIRDRVIRPGASIDCHPSDEVELKKQIRQVAGLGYANEFIEQSVKANGYNPQERSADDNCEFKFVVSGSSSSSISSAKSSSCESTPTKKKK